MDHIIDLVKYNVWANERIVEWLRSNPLELMSKEVPSSFPAITQTIKHIAAGQDWYYAIITKSDYTRIENEDPDFLMELLVNSSENFLTMAQQLTESDWYEELEVKMKLKDSFHPVHVLIQHIMNHSTYHRGQIITIGHQLKLNKPPSTDYLFYRMNLHK